MKRTVFSLILALSAWLTVRAAEWPLIPYPQSVVFREGVCRLSRGFVLKGDRQNRTYLENMLVSDFALVPSRSGVPVELEIHPGIAGGPEAYRLTVSPCRIKIEAAASSGIFYGIQTLRQLIKDRQCPCLVIEDRPAFAWRSYMLDEARHFQGKETVKQLLDEMALLKFNTFHWHLTDDSGWRIEIKKYPLLTQIGSVRDSSQINDNGKKWASTRYDGKVHQGFYTQEDIKEIVEYARQRHIRIIPEISMPGHASAAVAAYPWLGTRTERIKVPARFGVGQTVFNPADERVIRFLHDVLREVSRLFPSDVIHIGGDEVKYDQWSASPAVARYMQEHHLAAYSDVQVKFTNDISHFIADSLGRQMMGWNEILGTALHEWSRAENASERLSRQAIVHFWKGQPDDLKEALRRGHRVVNSHHEYTYLDYDYHQIPLSKAYYFNPAPDTLTAWEKQKILGLGCQMWGEWTPTPKEVEYQTYPRIAAYAEAGWTPGGRKDYARFKKGLAFFTARWREKGYHSACASLSEDNCFVPGAVWPDNNGVPINAHGGGFLFEDGVYYWFGEHKTEGEAGNYAHVGVHCYSSRDLYRWRDEGIALAVLSGSDIEAGCILERPKVIKNDKTGKYVMWFHLEPKGRGYQGALSGVAVSDRVTGPYTYLRAVRPNAGHYPFNVLEIHKGSSPAQSLTFDGGSLPGDADTLNILGRDFQGGQMARDMTLFVDDDGTAYHIYASEENSTLHIAELSDDYLSHTGRYGRFFVGRFMEAPAMFKRKGKYYLMMSGCTGWRPNQARSAVSDSIWGPWVELGDPCIGDSSQTTFHSQSTYILPVRDRQDAYIYIGDRWNPLNAIDGRYIWLPIRFDDGRFTIEWKDRWCLE